MGETPKNYNGKRITYPNIPSTNVTIYMTPERKQALVQLGEQQKIAYGCLVTDAVEAMFGEQLDAIEGGK